MQPLLLHIYSTSALCSWHKAYAEGIIQTYLASHIFHFVGIHLRLKFRISVNRAVRRPYKCQQKDAHTGNFSNNELSACTAVCQFRTTFKPERSCIFAHLSLLLDDFLSNAGLWEQSSHFDTVSQRLMNCVVWLHAYDNWCLSNQHATQLFDPICLNSVDYITVEWLFFVHLLLLCQNLFIYLGLFIFVQALWKLISCGFSYVFHLFLSLFCLSMHFLSLSHKTDNKPSHPQRSQGMMLSVKRSLFVAVPKIATALAPSSRLLSYYCTGPLSVTPQTPTHFFVDIYKGFCSFLELQTLSWRLFVARFFLVGFQPITHIAYFLPMNTVNLIVMFDSWTNRYYK